MHADDAPIEAPVVAGDSNLVASGRRWQADVIPTSTRRAGLLFMESADSDNRHPPYFVGREMVAFS